MNALVYDWTDKSCDAIVIPGSDAAGVKKAIERFRMILQRQGVPLSPRERAGVREQGSTLPNSPSPYPSPGGRGD